eukprot:gene49751-60904_t
MPNDPAAPRPPAVPLADPSKTEIPQSRVQRILAYRVLLGLAVMVFVLDQLTKLWIAKTLPYGTYGELYGAIRVIKGFFYLVHVGNTGAAWSMFTGQSVMLAVLAGGTIVAIYFWRAALGLRDRFAQIAFGLLCGGIVGNLVDRIAYGHVIDFVDLHFGTYVYPTFNVADSGICIGVFLYLWQNLRGPK